MKRHLLLSLSIMGLCTALLPGLAQALTIWPAGYSYTTVLNDSTLTNPTAIEVANDGRLFIAERAGAISTVPPSGGTRHVVKTLAVKGAGERGLLNIALDNDFVNYPFMYAYYTGATDSKLHIGKMAVHADGSLGDLTDIFVGSKVFDQYHNGGGLDTDLQGHIYFSVGENEQPLLAQDANTEAGKVLRINRDGSIPTDNPFLSNPNSLPALYAIGFRNPFRLSVDRSTGKVYVGDVGSDYAEELNQVLPGKNYGWPNQEGDRCNATPCPYEQPLYFYRRGTSGLATVLGPLYRGSAYPAAMQGRLFFGDWMVGLIDTIDPAAPPGLANFSTGNGNIVDFDLGADGKVYFIEHYSGKVQRIDYSGGGVTPHPPTAEPTCTPPSGPVPLTINCSAHASDEDGDVLSYQWDFGDGTTSALTNPSHTYTTVGVHTVTLAVKDATATTTKTLSVQAGQAPTVQVISPDDAQVYKAGDMLAYHIEAQDVTGLALPDDKVSVKINLHHNEHEHDFMPPTPGKTGSVQLPVTGETEPAVFYRLYATATDADGLQTTTTRDIPLLKTNLTLKTNIATGSLRLDGLEHPSGSVIQGVAGMLRTVEAPPAITTDKGQLYTFSAWSDGGARLHQITFPAADTNLTATYVPQAGNLIKNPSLDLYSADLQKPAFWHLSRWNNMTSTFDFQGVGRNQSGGCRLVVSGAPMGSSSFCHPDPITIQPGKSYTFSNWYQSNAFTAVFVLYMNDSGMYDFQMLSSVPPSSDWREQSVAFTPPAGAQRFTIFQNIYTDGNLNTDDYMLTETTALNLKQKSPALPVPRSIKLPSRSQLSN